MDLTTVVLQKNVERIPHLQSPFKRGKLELNWSRFAAEDADSWLWKSHEITLCNAKLYLL